MKSFSREMMIARLLCMLGLVHVATLSPSPSIPKLPLQFRAKVNITAHHVDKTKAYPPWLRELDVHYDFVEKHFVVDFLHTRRTAIRRYSKEDEFLITRIDGVADCRRSKLRDVMPPPAWPEQAVYEGTQIVQDQLCNHWREDLGSQLVDIYLNAESGAPVRVGVESVEQTNPVRLTVPDITYDVYEFQVGPVPAKKLNIPKDVKVMFDQGGFTHTSLAGGLFYSTNPMLSWA